MDPNKDPASDREEFKSRLESMLNPFKDSDLENAVIALINDDRGTIDADRVKIAAKQTRLDNYLAAWDAAADYAARQVVVGSVTGSVTL